MIENEDSINNLSLSVLIHPERDDVIFFTFGVSKVWIHILMIYDLNT
jgi:hypothetical protein